MLTQDRVRELLDYNADTGEFIWRVSRGKAREGSVAGNVNNNGYMRIKIYRKEHLAHRLAWLWSFGYFPEHQIDHINRDRADNRIENLREVSRSCNLRNSKLSVDNTSGVKGVSWDKIDKRWRAHIKINGKTICLGLHETLIDAACHRLAAEQAEGWSGCDSSSPAFKYVNQNITLTSTWMRR